MRKLLYWSGGLSVALLVALLLLLAFPPERWIADRIESAGSDYLDAQLEIGDLSLDLLSWTPAAQVEAVTLQRVDEPPLLDARSLNASVDVLALFKGDLVLEQVGANDTRVALAVDEDGRSNWAFLVPDTEPDAAPNTDASEPAMLPAIRTLQIQGLQLTLDDAAADRSIDLVFDAAGSTIDSTVPTTVQARGTVNELPASLDATVSSLATTGLSPEDLKIDVKAGVGDSELAASGTIGEPATLEGLEIDFDVAADGLTDVEALTGLALPAVPPFQLAGELSRDGDAFVLQQFTGQLGDSDVAGDIRANLTVTPPELYATVVSQTLDLDDIAGLAGGTPDPDETATEEQREVARAESGDGRLIPDLPIDLLPLTRLFNGAVDYRAESVQSEVWPVDALDVRVEVDGDTLRVDPLNVKIADGQASGTLGFDVAPQPPEGVLELEISRIDLKRVMKAAGIDDDSFGIMGGQMKFWMAGGTLAEMASSLDGGSFLLMTDGRLDALVAELGGIDVFESVALLIDPDKTLTDIRCAYLDLQAADGVLDVARFVLDTDDTVFLADGSVDLGAESLDLTLEPHPKDISVLAAETAVHLEGTLAQPAVAPGRSLLARAAAAAVLASVVGPAAALIPFVDNGSGEDSEYCNGLVSSLDDNR